MPGNTFALNLKLDREKHVLFTGGERVKNRRVKAARNCGGVNRLWALVYTVGHIGIHGRTHWYTRSDTLVYTVGHIGVCVAREARINRRVKAAFQSWWVGWKLSSF